MMTFCYCLRLKLEIIYLLSNLAEICTRVLNLNLNSKTRYEYNLFMNTKSVNFSQALFDKNVAMATPLVTVDSKPFQMKPYIIILKARQFH